MEARGRGNYEDAAITIWYLKPMTNQIVSNRIPEVFIIGLVLQTHRHGCKIFYLPIMGIVIKKSYNHTHDRTFMIMQHAFSQNPKQHIINILYTGKY